MYSSESSFLDELFNSLDPLVDGKLEITSAVPTMDLMC